MPVMSANDSMARLTRLGRIGRSVLVAGASTLVALLSHVLAGGAVPELAGILVPFGLAVVVGLPLAGRLRSLPRLATAVVLSQLLYHWLFVLGAAGSATLVAAPVASPVGHGDHSLVLIGGLTETGSAELLMWAGHGLAALVTILLIRRGDTALLGLRRLAMRLAHAILPRQPRLLPIATVARIRAGVGARRRLPALRMLAEAVSRRGPPHGAATAIA